MSSTEIYESLLQQVVSLDRSGMIERLQHFPGDLRLDFSEEYLRSCDSDRLRHLLLAALWRCQMKSKSR